MHRHRTGPHTLRSRLAGLFLVLALTPSAARGAGDAAPEARLDTLSESFLARALESLEPAEEEPDEAPSPRRGRPDFDPAGEEPTGREVDVEKVIELFRAAREAAESRTTNGRQALERILLPMAEFSLAHLRLDEALPVYHQLLTLRRRDLGDEHPLVGRAWARLGSVQRLLQQDEEAEASLVKALAILEQRAEENRLAMSRLLSDLAIVHARTDRMPQAEALAAQAVELAVAGEQEPPPEPVAAAFESQAQVYFRQGILDEAEAAIRRVLAVHERAGQKEWVPRQLLFLSLVFEDQDRPLEAYLVEKRGLHRMRAVGQRDHPVPAFRRERMARLLEAVGPPFSARAAALRREAGELRRRQLAAPRAEVAEALEREAGRFLQLWRVQEGRVALRHTAALYRALGADHAASLERVERRLARLPEQEGAP